MTPLPLPLAERVFAALFNVVKTVQGVDWSGNVMPLQFSSRDWVKVGETPDGVMPALYQLDPLFEKDIRTGRGRSRRVLHALVDIRLERQQPDEMPANQPFATIFNTWQQNFYNLLSPSDNPTLGGLVEDCYPIDWKYDYGLDTSRVAVIQAIIELITGG